jgi:hypothetical protein
MPLKTETEYNIIRAEGGGYAVFGPGLTRPCKFDTAMKAVALAKHLLGRNGGVITRVEDGTQIREKFSGKEIFTGNIRPR